MEDNANQWVHGSGIPATCSNCGHRIIKEGLLYCGFDPPKDGKQELVEATDRCSNHTMIQTGVAKNEELIGTVEIAPYGLTLMLKELDILDKFGDEEK